MRQGFHRYREGLTLALGLALVLAFGASALAAAAGEWLVADRTARIKILDCAGALWGVVTWEADPGIDSKNPDPERRNRPITGTAILRGLKPAGNNRWDGSIYNPDDGKTYMGGVTVLDAQRLRVRGCVLFVLCGGETWTRFDTAGSASEPDSAMCSRLDPGQSRK